ncbi:MULTISPECIES: glycoside hydrolase family 32 protein [Natrialbaceae]|uniref:glycoside hydrolase family 32 protein n=1 Tax=Natrialbaceae TaxID=1644061 RepID=UPI00207D6B3A|nr:glycoside hydrolase family 32 protein [Natronococcus sp. CG52]
MKPDRSPAAQWDAGWSGTLSLPRQVELDADGRLRQRPAPELTELRESHEYGDERVLEDERRQLPVNSRSFELRAEVRLDDAAEFGLAVRESPDGEETTLIRYTREGDVVVDRSASTADPQASDAPVSMPVTPVDDTLSLRVLVDGSVVELFANERHCLTTRIFPTREDSDGVSIHAADGTAAIESIDVWTMGSAWEEERESATREEAASSR